MALDPILKRIIVDPAVPGYAPAPVRLLAGLGFVGFVSAVIYGKWVAPTHLAERVAKETAAAAAGAHH
jgi:hypothetical protein